MATRTLPFWQIEPCPTWCIDGHEDDDHPDDRKHYSDWHTRFPLVLMEGTFVGWRYYTPELDVFLAQDYRETTPRVLVQVNENEALTLTVAETVRLAAALREAAELAAHPDNAGSPPPDDTQDGDAASDGPRNPDK